MGHSFNSSEADPALKIEYPITEADKKGNNVGYVIITVNETARTMNAVQKVYDPDTKVWRIGDKFSLTSSGAVITNKTVQ